MAIHTIAFPETWSPGDEYEIHYDFSPGVPADKRITLVRRSDRCLCFLRLDNDAPPPTKEILDAAMPKEIQDEDGGGANLN